MMNATVRTNHGSHRSSGRSRRLRRRTVLQNGFRFRYAVNFRSAFRAVVVLGRGMSFGTSVSSHVLALLDSLRLGGTRLKRHLIFLGDTALEADGSGCFIVNIDNRAQQLGCRLVARFMGNFDGFTE